MKILSLLLNLANVGIAAASVAALLPTVMMFGASGSENKKSVWFLSGVFAFFPFVAASLILGWARWSLGQNTKALRAGAVAPVYAAFCLNWILD